MPKFSAALIFAGVLLAATVLPAAPPHVVEAPPLTPAQQLKKFRLPPGFKIELVASEPQVIKPINMNFDAKGRLYVTQSIEYPYAAEEGKGRDRILRIEKFGGAEKYNLVKTYIDKLNIPIGVVPVKRGVVAFSIPHIYQFFDSKENGVIDRRRVLYGPFGRIDTHGLNNGFTRWLDGWIYAGHGYRNTSQVEGLDGGKLHMNSGNVYRFDDNRRKIEIHSRGQVNPFGLCFDRLGNLFSADCHSRPVTMNIRGAYYPSFGKPHDGLGFGPELMRHSHGSTGIAGVVYYEADNFPERYVGTLFVGNPITGAVNHDTLKLHGGTYEAIEQPDFLQCDDPWFRPVDLKMGPDGALYIADFYNRIIGHYEVPLDHPGRDRTRGRIWRVTYEGTDEEPALGRDFEDLTEMTILKLWQTLAHPNLVVRTLATHEIVDRYDYKAIPGITKWMQEDNEPLQRAHGLWALHRLNALSDEMIARLAADESRLVRTHLMKALAEREQWKSGEFELVQKALADTDPFVARAAADALGRHRRVDNIGPLAESRFAAAKEDAALIHTVRIALRDQLAEAEVMSQLRKPGALDSEIWPAVLDVLVGLRNAQSAELALLGLKQAETDGGRRLELLEFAARQLPREQLSAVWQAATDSDAQSRLAAWKRVAVAQPGAAPPAAIRRQMIAAVGSAILKGKRAPMLQAAELAGAARLKELQEDIRSLADKSDADPDVRLAMLDALQQIDAAAAVASAGAIVANLQAPTELRKQTIAKLGAWRRDEGIAVLAEAMKTAPSNMSLEIAQALSQSRSGGEALLAAVEQGVASPRLLLERRIQDSLKANNPDRWQDRLARATAALPPVNEQIARQIAQRRAALAKHEGRAEQGQAVFKKRCAACHRLGQEGAQLAPALDGVGLRSIDRLLEDILDPHRNVDPRFRRVSLMLHDGRVLTGLVVSEDETEVQLADEQGKQMKIAKSEIEARRNSPLSAMPDNVTGEATDAEFADLVAFLKAQNVKQ